MTTNSRPDAILPAAAGMTSLPELDIPFRTLGAAFGDFAARHPRKPAIHSIDQDVSLDFAALDDLVERTAARMAEFGISRGSRVAILSGECVEKLVLMFAAWRCGASACPFHTEIPAGHLGSILAAIDPSLVVWHRDLDGPAILGGLACPQEPFGQLGEGEGFLARPGTGPLPPRGEEYGPADEGCIFATSGTTDRPKCVVWDHLGLWMCGLSTIDFTAMTADDRVLEYRTFSWLSPQIVTFMPFVSLGLTIVIADGFSRTRFFGWIRDHTITVAAGVPTVINMLLDDPVDVPPGDLASLRLMTASSAPLAPDRWRRFEERYGITVLQFYGASEGGWLCGNRHDRRRVGTAGPPARYMDLAIVDDDGRTCPPGVAGEITIRGPQTATATISSDGQWEDRTGFRLSERARTGDLGVMDDEGFVTVTGRVKDVIIRGGVSIAPLEIDAAMARNPDISEAAAIGIPDPVWGEEIACYVVASPGAKIDDASVLAHAKTVLPPSRQPRRVVLVDRLPRNDRGKIRRDALKRMWIETGEPEGQGHN